MACEFAASEIARIPIIDLAVVGRGIREAYGGGDRLNVKG
jgi:hypothetical protein